MSHTSTSVDPIEEEGFFPTLRRKLFGARIARLSERKASAHFLSYLMIVATSIAVLLVFGHAEVPLLLSGNLAVMGIAALVLFLLIITVVAADWALIESVLRLGALARNRQLWTMAEHLAYIVFVLLTEGVTYGVVLVVAETHPQALVQPAPIIPTGSFLFLVVAFLRVVLTCWTIVQLIIVSGTLPVMLSTIMSQGKEIIGAHALRQMAHLDISRVPVAATVRTYARMDTPPRPIRTWWNGWLVERAIAREAEEARRAGIVIDALQELGIPGAEPLPTLPPTTPPPEPPRPRRYTPYAPDERDGNSDEMTDATDDLPEIWIPPSVALNNHVYTTPRRATNSATEGATIARDDAATAEAYRDAPMAILSSLRGATNDLSHLRRARARGVRQTTATTTGMTTATEHATRVRQSARQKPVNIATRRRRRTPQETAALLPVAQSWIREQLQAGTEPSQRAIRELYGVDNTTARALLDEARREVATSTQVG